MFIFFQTPILTTLKLPEIACEKCSKINFIFIKDEKMSKK